MKDMLPVLVALLVGAAAVLLFGNDERAGDAADPQLSMALTELREEVQRLREQIAKRPELVAPHRAGPYNLPNGGNTPGLREPDDPVPPPPPAGAPVEPDVGSVEHVHRERPGDPMTERAEEDDELLRKFSTRYHDDEEHKQTLRAWLLVREKAFLRRFGQPDEIRADGGMEIWVYGGLFGPDSGREINLKFHKGRLIGVY